MNIGSNKIRRLLFSTFLTAIMGVSSTASAQQSAQNMCDRIQERADDRLWQGLREAADEAGCRKRWFFRFPNEFVNCAYRNISEGLGNTVRGRWNRIFDRNDAEWATWGPRAVGPTPETGTIRGGFKRTFFASADMGSDTVIRVNKIGGRSSATITVCNLVDGGSASVLATRSVPRGAGGTIAPITLNNNPRQRILAVVVDTPTGVKRFQYSVTATNRWNTNQLGPVDGLADIHLHQVSDRGFAGRALWGEHAGPPRQALAEDRSGAGSRLLESMAHESEDGVFERGGNGFPSFSDWPHHSHRGHQGAHMRWLKRAHDNGLNLIVVSVVNNDYLCQLLKGVDNRGNIRNFTSNGQKRGWKSTAWRCSDHDNITRQLAAIHKLDQEHDWYRVAMNPYHARRIISEGDMAVVISLETDNVLAEPGLPFASGAGNWENKLDEYKALGVSTLQLVHESDSRFCGAAPHRDDLELGQILRHPTRGVFQRDANGKNRRGLESDGQGLVRAMIARNMPIDLAHGSEKCRNDIFALVNQLRPNGYGLYDSHTKFERLMTPIGLDREEEFLITRDIMSKYRSNKVLVGLRTAAFDVNDAPRGTVENSCPGSVRSYAQAVDYADQMGLDVAYGTDFNGLIGQLGPRYGGERCYSGPFAMPARNIARGTGPGSEAVEPNGLSISQAFRNPQAGAVQAGSSPAQPTKPQVTSQGSRHVAGRIDRMAGPMQVASLGQAGEPMPAPGVVTTIDNQNFHFDGLATIAMLPDLQADLERLNTPGANRLARSAEAYLRMWERTFP